MTDRAALERFADEVVARFGRIDLWVNNAGLLGDIRPLAEADPAASRPARVEVNVNGTLHGSAVFAAHVRRRSGPGVLVNISSGAATTPYEGWGAYCASKAAVDQLTRVARAGGGRATGCGPTPCRPGWSTPTCRWPSGPRTSATSPRSSASAALAVEHRFNSPAWVADHILAIAFGGQDPGQVTVRVPEQPVPGAAG